MSSWLRRLSRDRSSKNEQDNDRSDHEFHNAASYRPSTWNAGTSTSRKVSASKDSQFDNGTRDDSMLRNSMPAASQYDHAPGYSMHGNRGSTDGVNNMHSSPRNNNPLVPKPLDSHNTPTRNPKDPLTLSPSYGASIDQPTPDPLQRAFNEALKPYLAEIDNLKAELESARNTITSISSENQSLSNERNALHGWIDKRGLRPDLPANLANSFPQSNFAASTLSTQLDRKMTMLNYSLHHLADSAPEPLPASTVTSTLSTLLPPIQHLASLPSGGPSFAFETLIKLAGNLNSHSTGEETDFDRDQIHRFYDDLDQAMAGVVGRRFQARGEGLEDWDVGKDVKRLDKTGAFLRKEMGVDNYFQRSLELMKDGVHGGGMFSGQQGGNAGWNEQGGR